MNPIESARIARDPEGYWRSCGWGPEWRFPATRSDGEPLVLSLRVPVDWKAFDVMQVAADAVSTPAPLARTMAILERGIDAAGVIAIMGIGHALPREGTTDAHLFVTLTVALADATGPYPEPPGAEVEPVEFEHAGGSYGGVRMRRVRNVAVLPAQPPLPVLTVQYLVHTDHGVLAITFTTPQAEAFEKLALLLDKIAGACSLDG